MFNLSFMLNSLQDWFSNSIAIVGMVIIAIGLAMILLARSIARFIRKAKEVSNQDRIFVGVALSGVVLMLLGFVLLIINCM